MPGANRHRRNRILSRVFFEGDRVMHWNAGPATVLKVWNKPKERKARVRYDQSGAIGIAYQRHLRRLDELRQRS